MGFIIPFSFLYLTLNYYILFVFNLSSMKYRSVPLIGEYTELCGDGSVLDELLQMFFFQPCSAIVPSYSQINTNSDNWYYNYPFYNSYDHYPYCTCDCNYPCYSIYPVPFYLRENRFPYNYNAHKKYYYPISYTPPVVLLYAM